MPTFNPSPGPAHFPFPIFLEFLIQDFKEIFEVSKEIPCISVNQKIRYFCFICPPGEIPGLICGGEPGRLKACGARSGRFLGGRQKGAAAQLIHLRTLNSESDGGSSASDLFRPARTAAFLWGFGDAGGDTPGATASWPRVHTKHVTGTPTQSPDSPLRLAGLLNLFYR